MPDLSGDLCQDGRSDPDEDSDTLDEIMALVGMLTAKTRCRLVMQLLRWLSGRDRAEVLSEIGMGGR